MHRDYRLQTLARTYTESARWTSPLSPWPKWVIRQIEARLHEGR